MSQDSASIWYATLEKPFFAPPAWVFGPVWSFLYLLITLSFGYVFVQALRRKWPLREAMPFAANLLANLAFSPLQFGLQNMLLATLDIFIILFTLVLMIRIAWRRQRIIAYMQLPYFLWVSFATVLQLSITWLNW